MSWDQVNEPSRKVLEALPDSRVTGAAHIGEAEGEHAQAIARRARAHLFADEGGWGPAYAVVGRAGNSPPHLDRPRQRSTPLRQALGARVNTEREPTPRTRHLQLNAAPC